MTCLRLHPVFSGVRAPRGPAREPTPTLGCTASAFYGDESIVSQTGTSSPDFPVENGLAVSARDPPRSFDLSKQPSERSIFTCLRDQRTQMGIPIDI